MKLAWKLALVLLFVVAYVVAINLFANFISYTNTGRATERVETKKMFGDIIEIGVSDSVSVSVIRNRFYGNIIVEGETEYLYLLKLIKIPKKVAGHNFYIFHFIFLIVILIIAFLMVTDEEDENKIHDKQDTRNIYKPFVPYYPYEELA